MPGFLEDIEREIALQSRGRPRRRKAAAQPKPATGAKSGSGAVKAAMSRVKGPRPGGLARRARALGAIDYSVPEPVLVMAQPKSMACWATALTILYSWRDRQTRTIEDVTSEVGAEYRTLYDTNAGLSSAKKDDLMRDARLGNMAGTNLSAEGWADLMRNHGPIWITTSESAGIHGRILHGIHGDGTGAGTMLDIIDPAGGRQYQESVAAFLPKFEAEALAGSTDRVNIVFLEDGRSGAMSLRRKARGLGRWGRMARAASALDYTVPGIVDLVPQPTPMSCWAASYTMLRNWANNQSRTIETNLAALGGPWLQIFRDDTGLSGARTAQFVTAAGLLAEPAASYTTEAWAGMLRDFGPLMLVTDEAPGKSWAVHARVVYGIHGDGTADGTYLRVHDPAPIGVGRSFDEKVSDFLPKYEEMVAAEGFLGLQIVHFPADAQLSVTRSLRAGTQRRAGRSGRAHALTAAPTAARLASRFGGEIPQRVEEIIAGGIAEAAVADFLASLMPGPMDDASAPAKAASRRGARALTLAADGTTVTLPTGVVLEGWQAQLFLDVMIASMAVSYPAAPVLLRLFQEMANEIGATIGIGAALGGAGAAGDGVGLGLSAGMLIAPDNRIGFYGGLEHAYEGFSLGGALTLQITVVQGGPSNFSGRAVTVGGSAGEGLVGGGRLLMAGDPPSPIGLMVEVGLGAGLAPVEFTATLQDTITSLSVPGSVRALTAADPAVAKARDFGPEAVEVVESLLQEGVSSDEIKAFLAGLSPETAPAQPMGLVRSLGEPPEDSFEIHMPGATTFTGWRAKLFLAALAGINGLATMGVGVVPTLAAIGILSEVSDRLGITIGVGPAISGGVVAGMSFGAGLLFAPDRKIGYYGSAAIIMGVIASIGASAQLTILTGGPDLMDGRAYAVGGNVSLPTGISGAAGLHFLFDDEGNQIGMTLEVGVSALDGLPVEAMIQMQFGAQTVDQQGFHRNHARAAGLSSMWARSQTARRLARAQSAQSDRFTQRAQQFGVTRLARQFELPDLSAWQHLIRFAPSSSISTTLYNKMNAITPAFTLWDEWPIQPLRRGEGPINLDYYPVRVSRMPTLDGSTATGPSLVEAMRLRLNDLVDNRYANFEPYDDDEGTLWTSSSPEGAVLHIDMRMGGPNMNPDDGSVACTRKRDDHWIFSTIWSIADAAHPVSGNRQFGFTPDNGGGVILYTRGADRPTRVVDNMMSDTVFSGAHSLWMSLQQGLKTWIDGAGGAAEILSPVSERYDWDAVRNRYG